MEGGGHLGQVGGGEVISGNHHALAALHLHQGTPVAKPRLGKVLLIVRSRDWLGKTTTLGKTSDA